MKPKKIYIEEKEQALSYCLKMNCLFCLQNKGNYNDCPYFEQKANAMNKGGTKNNG